jgi:hypothetical protein
MVEITIYVGRQPNMKHYKVVCGQLFYITQTEHLSILVPE